MFVHKSDIQQTKQKKRQGSWPQKSELGMHQNPHFQQNSLKNKKTPEINPSTSRKKRPYFLVCEHAAHKVHALHVPAHSGNPHLQRSSEFALQHCIAEAGNQTGSMTHGSLFCIKLKRFPTS